MSQTPTEQNIPQIFNVIPSNLFPFIKGRDTFSQVSRSFFFPHACSLQSSAPSLIDKALVHLKYATRSMDFIRHIAN